MADTQYFLDSQPLFDEIEDLTQHFKTPPPKKKRVLKKKEIEVTIEKTKVNYSNSNDSSNFTEAFRLIYRKIKFKHVKMNYQKGN